MNVSWCPRATIAGTPGDQIEIHATMRIYMARSSVSLNPKFGFIPGV
jgi:hypothetical protein